MLNKNGDSLCANLRNACILPDETMVVNSEKDKIQTFSMTYYQNWKRFRGENATFQKRRSRFENLANSYLSECGFYELYLLNPFELFLTTCLFYEEPFKYFLAVLRYARSQ